MDNILGAILGNDKAKVGLTSLLAVAAVGLAAFTAVKAIDESNRRNALASAIPVGEQEYGEEEEE